MPSLIERATKGDRDALEQLVASVRDDAYALALRMLWHPEDAEDAAQEILIRVITHLGSFRGESAFRTWVYRIAANYLLTTRRRRAEKEQLTFDEFSRQLAVGLSDGPGWNAASPARRALIEEVKIGCSQGMLLCLDRRHRLAYILGEVLELDGPTAAKVLDVTPATFRKQLSRARADLHAFMHRYCGLVASGAVCRCHRRVEGAIAATRVMPGRLLFARHPVRGHPTPDDILAGTRAVEGLRNAAAEVQKSNPNYAAPERLVQRLQNVLASDRCRILRT